MSSIVFESYYTQNLSAVSMQGTTFTDIVSRSFSPQYNQDFIVMGGGSNQTDSGSIGTEARLIINSTPTQAIGFVHPSTDFPQPGGFWHILINDIASGNYAIKTQQKTTSAGGRAAIRGNSVLALGGLNVVAYGSFLSAVTHTTSEADSLVVNYTPTEGGKDHLILASCEVNSVTNAIGAARVKVDGSESMIAQSYRGALGTNALPLFFMKKVNWDTSAHTVKITGESQSLDNSTLTNQRITIIQLDL